MGRADDPMRSKDTEAFAESFWAAIGWGQNGLSKTRNYDRRALWGEGTTSCSSGDGD